MQVFPMELMDEFFQWVLDLHHHHVDDHMGSLQNHEQLDGCLTNEFFQLFHFGLKMHHYY
jgi:hypothetical protein